MQRFKPFDLDESDPDSDQESDLEDSTEDWHASDPDHGDEFFGLKLIADHDAINDHGRPSGYGLDKNDLIYNHGKNKVKKNQPVIHQDNKRDPEHRQSAYYDEPGRHRTAPVYRQRAMTPWPVSHESANASARESKSISRYRAAPKTWLCTACPETFHPTLFTLRIQRGVSLLNISVRRIISKLYFDHSENYIKTLQ
jgi:hypothetical protein